MTQKEEKKIDERFNFFQSVAKESAKVAQELFLDVNNQDEKINKEDVEQLSVMFREELELLNEDNLEY